MKSTWFVVSALRCALNLSFFFFNDTATTEIYTLSLHDALPISRADKPAPVLAEGRAGDDGDALGDRKSTRLNSSHANISYAVFCLKKKKPGAAAIPLPKQKRPCVATPSRSRLQRSVAFHSQFPALFLC